MTLSKTFVVLWGFAVSMFSATAGATTIPSPLFTFTDAYTVGVGNFNIGNEFQTGQQLFVSKIGAFINPNTQVALGVTTFEYKAYLYADDYTLLASATIPIGTPVDAQSFAYVPLTYTLLANTDYILTSYSVVAGSTAFAYSTVSPSPTAVGSWNLGTTFGQNLYGFGDVDPTNHNPGYIEFMGGNLLVANELAVPEPSTICLLGLGAIGLAIRTRRRRSAV